MLRRGMRRYLMVLLVAMFDKELRWTDITGWVVVYLCWIDHILGIVATHD